MNRNNTKIGIVVLISVILIAGAFALVTVTTAPTTETDTAVTVDEPGSNEKNNTSSKKKAAEELIEDTVSQDKVEKTVGKWEKFEMSSKGCERGVYAGKFYYEEFTIFSRTYDKGKTFRVISVN